MDQQEKIINIEYPNINQTNNNINKNNNEEQIYKLDFNFDILNEPMPDFTKSKTNEKNILSKNNFIYKRKYNEVNNENYTYHGKVIPKIN